MKGIIYYELLESHQTVTAERYRQQLQRVAEAHQQKRPIGGRKRRKVLLLRDNERPHLATINQEINLGGKFYRILHIAQTLILRTITLFRSLDHFLRGRWFKDVGEVRKCIEDFISLKPPFFYRDGISQLPEKWRRVVGSDGNYFVD